MLISIQVPKDTAANRTRPHDQGQQQHHNRGPPRGFDQPPHTCEPQQRGCPTQTAEHCRVLQWYAPVEEECQGRTAAAHEDQDVAGGRGGLVEGQGSNSGKGAAQNGMAGVRHNRPSFAVYHTLVSPGGVP